MPNKRKLPIGIQTFREIREDGHYYVDKTPFIQRLVAEGKHYFLSRPRRFGKSLLLDTIKELFEGTEPLFRNLAIYDDWDWSAPHPVLRLSFGSGSFSLPGQLEAGLMDQLKSMERDFGVESDAATAAGRLARLIRSLRQKTQRRVVVLVDEYDKPILDALDAREVARANRDFLRGVYSVIKDRDADVRFTFATGVSRSSTGNLFSGVNNLIDITLDPRHSAICGYTEADLDTVFAPELAGLNRDEIRAWYNGYGWRGDERVYNPFDILHTLRNREFGPWWFEAAIPICLMKTMIRGDISPLSCEEIMATPELLSTFDVDNLPTETLLFQTGCRTITGEESLGGMRVYRLGYPNHAVRKSMNELIRRKLAQGL